MHRGDGTVGGGAGSGAESAGRATYVRPQQEAQRLLNMQEDTPPLGAISPEHRRIANGPQWKSFFFEGYGF
ncbi:hypothetical protein OAS19_05450 [Altererythrobacter sp.]|nr:hypothetical protein [Altererythrobacter sp.]